MAFVWNCKQCASGDRPNLYCCRSAKRWRGASVTRISPTSGRARGTSAPQFSSTVPAGKGEGGAAWRYAAIGPNKPLIAIGSRPSVDTTAFQLFALIHDEAETSANHPCGQSIESSSLLYRVEDRHA